MNLEVKVETRIPKPVHEVFEAITDKDKISNYFVREASASMTPGAEITWDFGKYGKGEVKVHKVERSRRVVFGWEATQVEIILQPEDDGTLVKIREAGWTEVNQKSIDEITDRTQGWTDMLLCMKAYLQFGVDLREPARVTEKVM
ncbi:MAG TPA: SRPBCC domain-containing protein [Ignavibacteriales bacterium]|nr:SRPBCC domain-containing protein [Ignavibacteriales bacterium]